MNAVIIEPGVPAVTIERRCGIDEVFTRPFIELMTLAPKNPVVRGLILAQTRKLPGLECESFEQIKEWVETTCERKFRATPGARMPARDGITIAVEFSETEYGRARYSVTRSGTDEFALDAEELRDLTQQAIDDGEGLDGVTAKIAEKIETDAWNRCEPSLDTYGEYDYDEHDSNDSGNSATEFSSSQVRERVRGFLSEHHPELLEALT